MRRDKGIFTLGLILSFWALALTNFSLPATAAYASVQVKLRAGTPVVLRLTQTISSKTARVGDPVTFEVARDVKVDDKVVISQGTAANGTVAMVDKNGLFGSAGKISITVQNVAAVDETSVSLRGTVAEEGKSNAVVSILLFIFCLFGFLIKGGDGVAGTGTEVKAFVDNDTVINI